MAIINISGTGSGISLNFESDGATTPVVNLNALAGTSGLTYNVSNAITLTNNTTFQGNGMATFNFSGVISGGGALTKTGNSTLTLSATNTYSGRTIVTGLAPDHPGVSS